MSDVNTETKNVASTTTVKATAKAANEPTFSKQQFINNAEALGYSKPIVIGAFFDAQKDKFTKKEVKDLVNTFLKKEVK